MEGLDKNQLLSTLFIRMAAIHLFNNKPGFEGPKVKLEFVFPESLDPRVKEVIIAGARGQKGIDDFEALFKYSSANKLPFDQIVTEFINQFLTV